MLLFGMGLPNGWPRRNSRQGNGNSNLCVYNRSTETTEDGVRPGVLPAGRPKAVCQGFTRDLFG